MTYLYKLVLVRDISEYEDEGWETVTSPPKVACAIGGKGWESVYMRKEG